MTASQAATSVSRYVAFMLLSWRLMPQALDDVAVYLTSTVVLSNICDLGVNVSCLRFSAARRGRQRLAAERRFLILRTFLTTAILGFIWLGAGMVATRILRRPEFLVGLRMACVTVLFSSYSSFALTLLQARSRFGRLSVVSCACAVAQLALIAVAYMGGHLSLTTLFVSDVLGKLVFIAAHGRLLAAVCRSRPRWGPVPAFSEMVGFSQWITLSTAMGALQNYVPVLILSRTAAPGELARYNVGLALAGVFALFSAAVMSVTMPEAIKSATLERAKYVKGVLTGGLLFGCVVIPLTWLCAPLATYIVGARFLAGIQVFRLLMVAQVLLTVTNPIQFLLYGMDRVKLCTAADAVVLGSFWLLAVPCGAAWAASGVAFALVVSQSFTKFAIVGYVLRLVFHPREIISRGPLPDAVLSE
jgi:O-antigen/teichoic acid export membrane protein